MDKLNLLILDNDSFYINNFYNYILQNYKNQIKATCFSHQENLNEYLHNEQNINVIFLSRTFYESNKEILGGKILIILGDKNKINEEIPEVKKYQSAETICSYLFDIVDRKRVSSNLKTSKIVSFYSPIGGVGNTTIAFSTALKLSTDSNKVLYLNFENTQSFLGFITKGNGVYNLSDLLITLKDDEENFEKIFTEGAIQFENTGFFYFNAVESVLDFEDLTFEDVSRFIDKIKEIAVYDYIIFDFPSNINTKYFKILDMSISVFVLLRQDKSSAFKVDSMLRQLDNIKNYKFIYNFYNKEKEKLLPKMVVSNKLPVIGKISFYKDIYGGYSIKDIKNSEYFEKINKIIEEL